MTKYMNDTGKLNTANTPNSILRNPSYALMIADDDNNIDQDFPEVSIIYMIQSMTLFKNIHHQFYLSDSDVEVQNKSGNCFYMVFIRFIIGIIL